MDKIINYLTEDCVLFAPKRLARPNDFRYKPFKKITNTSDCAFCIENKHMLEQIIYESDNKKCIILKNKFPALTSENSSHEVIIDSTDHNKSFCQCPIEDMVTVIDGLKRREKEHFANENTRLVQIFKNHGLYAGASMEHSHMQLMAIDYIPRKIETISKNMTKHRIEEGGCYLCTLEEGVEKFTVYHNETFEAIVKLDTLMSYTVDFLPRRHFSNISDMTDEEVLGFCKALKTVYYAIEKANASVNYNIIFYSSPRNEKGVNEDFHFFVQFVPRIHGFAGFEVATNNYINSVVPDKYAKKLENIIKRSSM